MGRNSRPVEAMNEDELADLSAVAGRHPNVHLYIFGSSVYGHAAPVDLDLLAVYTTFKDFDALHADLDRQAFSPLVDLVAMTPDELRDSGFLEKSQAVRLASPGR